MDPTTNAPSRHHTLSARRALCAPDFFPLTILSGLPSAAVGALATLLIFGAELNIYGFVGVIMLIGIVKKNAIMMIRDLRGVPPSVSPDHDDDDGGAHGDPPHRPRLRRGGRIASPAPPSPSVADRIRQFA